MRIEKRTDGATVFIVENDQDRLWAKKSTASYSRFIPFKSGSSRGLSQVHNNRKRTAGREVTVVKVYDRTEEHPLQAVSAHKIFKGFTQVRKLKQ